MKIYVTLLSVILTGLLYAETAMKPSNKAPTNLFVGIVVDSSPTSSKTWNIRKSRTIELITSLQEGDKIIVLKARPGSPAVYGATFIGGQEKSGANEIVSSVSVLNKELLLSADVPRACESIHDIFTSQGRGYKCLLVVLTSGKFKTDRIERILRTASQIKTLGGATCLTYDPAVARKHLINAGKRNDIEILLESNPGLPTWIQSKRDLMSPEPSPDKTEYVIIEPNLTPITNMLDDALTNMKSEVDKPVEKVTEYIIRKIPAEKEPNLISTIKKPSVTTEPPAKTTAPDEPSPRRSFPIKRFVIPTLIAIAAVILLFYLAGGKTRPALPEEMHDPDQQAANLKAVIGDQNIDLGPIELISELTIGNYPGCGIYIDDPQLSPEMARIFQSKRGFKIQNLETEVIYVNGQDVAPNKKAKFELPADIQLCGGAILNLFTETIQPEENGEYDDE